MADPLISLDHWLLDWACPVMGLLLARASNNPFSIKSGATPCWCACLFYGRLECGAAGSAGFKAAD